MSRKRPDPRLTPAPYPAFRGAATGRHGTAGHKKARCGAGFGGFRCGLRSLGAACWWRRRPPHNHLGASLNGSRSLIGFVSCPVWCPASRPVPSLAVGGQRLPSRLSAKQPEALARTSAASPSHDPTQAPEIAHTARCWAGLGFGRLFPCAALNGSSGRTAACDSCGGGAAFHWLAAQGAGAQGRSSVNAKNSLARARVRSGREIIKSGGLL